MFQVPLGGQGGRAASINVLFHFNCQAFLEKAKKVSDIRLSLFLPYEFSGDLNLSSLLMQFSSGKFSGH